MQFWSKIMLALITVVNALYIGTFVFSYLYVEAFIWRYWDLLWMAIYFFVVLKTYQMICNSLEQGLSPEYAIDVFAVFLSS